MADRRTIRLTPNQLGVLEAMTRGLSLAQASAALFTSLSGENACVRALRKRGLLVYASDTWSITEAGRAAVADASPARPEPSDGGGHS